MTTSNAAVVASFFWLSLELAAGREVDLETHLAFMEWALDGLTMPFAA